MHWCESIFKYVQNYLEETAIKYLYDCQID